MTVCVKIPEFLAPHEREGVVYEIGQIYRDLEPERIDTLSRNRVYVDKVFEDRRDESYILKILHEKLFSTRVYNKTNMMPDGAFQALPFTTRHETQLSIYMDGDWYGWHRDHNDQWHRLLNFVYYLNLAGDFTGGELELSHRPEEIDDVNKLKANETIPPIDNTLILFPSYIWHRVKEVKMQSNHMLHGRITINGHIGFWQ